MVYVFFFHNKIANLHIFVRALQEYEGLHSSCWKSHGLCYEKVHIASSDLRARNVKALIVFATKIVWPKKETVHIASSDLRASNVKTLIVLEKIVWSKNEMLHIASSELRASNVKALIVFEQIVWPKNARLHIASSDLRASNVKALIVFEKNRVAEKRNASHC